MTLDDHSRTFSAKRMRSPFQAIERHTLHCSQDPGAFRGDGLAKFDRPPRSPCFH